MVMPLDLFQRGCLVNQSNTRGNTVLHEAARWTNVGLVDALLQHRASVSARNHQSLTPMQLAQVRADPDKHLWLAFLEILSQLNDIFK